MRWLAISDRSIVLNLWVTWHEENSSWAYCSETFPAAWPGPLVETAFPLFQEALLLLWPFPNISSASTSLNPCLRWPEILFCPIGSAPLSPRSRVTCRIALASPVFSPSMHRHIGSILWSLILKKVCLIHHLALNKQKVSFHCLQNVVLQTEVFCSGAPCFSLPFFYGALLHYFALMKTYLNILSVGLETECAGPRCSHLLVI